MSDQQQRHGLIAGASLSHKTVNQDSFHCVRNENANISAIMVADGLGSHYGAEFASAIATKTLADHLQAACAGDELDLPALFAQAWQNIQEYACKNSPLQPGNAAPKDSFGTTLLCAVETEEHITLGYVGNGAIFHLRANFNTFPTQQLLPWTALNYLNPHSIPQDGRAALEKLLSLNARQQHVQPTILTLSKDRHFYGDIIVCCTDGICSYDQTAIGHDDKREIWVHAEPAVPLLFTSLAAFFHGPGSTETLTSCLHTFLHDLDERELVEDDCTVAVLITAKAMEYQEELQTVKTESTLA